MLSDLTQQLDEMRVAATKQTQQLNKQAALIARLCAANAYLRAENDIMQNSATFLANKVNRFKNSVAAMLRDSQNILTNNPTLRSVLPVGRVVEGHENSVLTLCNFAPCLHRDDLEALRVAAHDMTDDNFCHVMDQELVKTAIDRLQMWADNPVISNVLVAAYILKP